MAEERRALRADRATVNAWLDRLDRGTAAGRGVSGRRAQRYSYRAEPASLIVCHADDRQTEHEVACRNLSREGVGLVAGQFVYPQSACRVRLTRAFGGQETVPGRVVRCRYLVGSARLHEVGVHFDRPVDVAVYAPQSQLARILLVDDAPATRELVQGLLGTLHATLAYAADADEAMRRAAGECDLILIALDSEVLDGFGLTRDLRASGYIGPIVGLTAHPGPGLHARCVAAGCTGYISKPIIREDLQDLVAGLMGQPLLSSVADDPKMAPLVDRFVAGLRPRMTDLLLTLEQGQMERLDKLVCDLRAEAASYGFERITQEATYVQGLLAAGEPLRRVRRAVRHLAHVSLRARPATSPVDTSATGPLPKELWERLVTEVPGGTAPFAAR